jgi:hypothetical protein
MLCTIWLPQKPEKGFHGLFSVKLLKLTFYAPN